MKRQVVESEIKPGYRVLLKQAKENKMITTFMTDPFIVKSRNGNSVVIGAGDSQFKRSGSP